jgi:hypothetical protein
MPITRTEREELNREPERPGVIEHVLRPHPPWRTAEFFTECGHPCAEFAHVLSRDDLLAKVRVQGQMRAAMSTCMTCLEAARNNPGWERNPVAVVARECDRLRWSRFDEVIRPKARQFTAELRALAVLAAAHAGEFAELLAGLAEATDLADARQRRSAG